MNIKFDFVDCQTKECKLVLKNCSAESSRYIKVKLVNEIQKMKLNTFEIVYPGLAKLFKTSIIKSELEKLQSII